MQKPKQIKNTEKPKQLKSTEKNNILNTIEKDKILKSAEKNNQNLLSGNIAFEGAEGPERFGGIAKVVKDNKKLNKINFGDILIINMTSPRVVEVFKKIKGIVTDKGGAGCHAAIVSREMGIPCIIGTKKATQFFKDGEFIELNTIEGYVKKITKADYNQLLKAEKKQLKEFVKKEEKELKEITKTELEKKPNSILWFKDINKNDVGIVGGKGASLGEMSSIFPIPNGFCITAQAYEKEVLSVLSKVHKILKIDVNDQKQLEKASKEIEKLIIAVKMSDELKNNILLNYEKLGKGMLFVAVRSSATAEDLPEASFAGQQATFLNVRGKEDVIKYVKECWASLFTERAIYYREINKFKHEDVLISVVVQEMVNSEKAGVMFTVNPVTKNYNELLIEGSYGLGETVVSGQVTPDSYFIDKKQFIEKKTLSIKQKNIAEKTWGLFRDENGKNVNKNIENPNEQLLSEKELKELTEFGIKIEIHYGKPMDIEWAIANGKVYILQARPITTL